MRTKKIRVSELKDICIIYPGDIYDLACFLLKIDDEKNKETNATSRYTIHGLAVQFAILARIPDEQVKKALLEHNFPIDATINHDHEVNKRNAWNR